MTVLSRDYSALVQSRDYQTAQLTPQPSLNVQLLSRLSNMLVTAHSVAALASFLLFLVNGRFRTLLDRLLRMRLVQRSSQVRHQPSYEYLNRQLVWHAFTEFLLFVLPLVGIRRWRRWLSKGWRSVLALLQRKDAAVEETSLTGPLASLPERTCAICYEQQTSASIAADMSGLGTFMGGGIQGAVETDITSPYEAVPCGCVYCFVCLAQALESSEGDGWSCLRCGQLVFQCRPWHGDVQDEPEHTPEQDQTEVLTPLDPEPIRDDDDDFFRYEHKT